MNICDVLTRERILNERIPLEELLRDSVYYPACGSDGRPIRHCNTIWRDMGVTSFVYCDFMADEKEIVRDMHEILGYHIVAHRSLSPEEYIPAGQPLELADFDGAKYYDTFLGSGDGKPFAHWAVFERDYGRDCLHGPDRFSLIYICGEGLATFQRLYVRHHIAPKMLCFIQCWGFAGNWTNFTDCRCSFAKTLRDHSECIPEWLCMGYYGEITGVLRLRGADDCGVRLVDYKSPRHFRNAVKVFNEYGRTVSVWQKSGRRYMGVSVHPCMDYTVYDITDSRYDIASLTDALVLHEKDRLAPGALMNHLAGIKGEDILDPVSPTPVLDEKLMYRMLDDNWSSSMAIAISRRLDLLYDGLGLTFCTWDIRQAAGWAKEVLGSKNNRKKGMESLEENIKRHLDDMETRFKMI